MALVAIMPPAPPAPPTPAGPAGAAAGPGGFVGLLNQLNGLQVQATAATNAVVTGQSANVASAMIAAEKAGLSLQLAVQTQQAAIKSYQTISQIP